MDFIEAEIDHAVEKESSARGAREPSGHELVAVGEHGVTICAREEATTANVFKKNTSHDSVPTRGQSPLFLQISGSISRNPKNKIAEAEW